MLRHLSIALAVVLAAGPVLSAQEKLLGKNAGEWVGQLKTSLDAKQRRQAAFALGKSAAAASARSPK